MSSRLPDSKRNELIAEYNEGKTNPDYEVIPSKTQKGKYTVRKRKVSLPENTQEPEPEPEPPEQPQQEEDDLMNYSPYYPQFNEEIMYRQYQAQLNQMMLEQMKLLRQNMKYSTYKQQKIKDKTNKIYGILSDAVNRNYPEPEPETSPNYNPEPDYNQQYYQPEQEEEPELEEEPEPEPEPELQYQAPEASPNYNQNYAQDYERDIDEMAGITYKPYSRKDRINWKNFNI